jgi:hypothetical protein
VSLWPVIIRSANLRSRIRNLKCRWRLAAVSNRVTLILRMLSSQGHPDALDLTAYLGAAGINRTRISQ